MATRTRGRVSAVSGIVDAWASSGIGGPLTRGGWHPAAAAGSSLSARSWRSCRRHMRRRRASCRCGQCDALPLAA
eukprot:5439255-Prymnesium_polylepis.2